MFRFRLFPQHFTPQGVSLVAGGVAGGVEAAVTVRDNALPRSSMFGACSADSHSIHSNIPKRESSLYNMLQ